MDRVAGPRSDGDRGRVLRARAARGPWPADEHRTGGRAAVVASSAAARRDSGAAVRLRPHGTLRQPVGCRARARAGPGAPGAASRQCAGRAGQRAPPRPAVAFGSQRCPCWASGSARLGPVRPVVVSRRCSRGVATGDVRAGAVRRRGRAADELQVEIRTATGGFVGRGDLGWRLRHGRWLIAEIDGREFHESPQAVLRDRSRQNALLATGQVQLLRFTSTDIAARHVIPTAIRAALRLRRHPLTSRPSHRSRDGGRLRDSRARSLGRVGGVAGRASSSVT